MRLIYNILYLASGEVQVTKPYVGPLDVGRMRLTVESPSLYTSVYGVVTDLIRSNPDVYIYMFARHKESEPFLGVFEDETVPRMAWVLIPASNMRLWTLPDVGGIDGAIDLFHSRHRTALPIDAVIGGNSFYARRPSVYLSFANRKVPGLARHESSYGPLGNAVESWGRPGKDQYMLDTMLASSLGIDHVFLNVSSKQCFFDLFFKNSLSPSMLRRLELRTTVLRNGIDTVLIDKWIEAEGGLKTDRGKSAGSFYALNANKGTADVLALYQKMAVAGQLDRVVVTWAAATPLEEGLPPENKSVPSQFEFQPRCSRNLYLKKAMTVAAAIFNSRNEGGPIAPVEAAFVGCIPIVPNRPWVKAMPPGWPFVYDTMDQAHSMLITAIEQQDKYRPLVREYAREHYSASVLGPAFMSIVREQVLKESRIRKMTDEEFLEWNKNSPFAQALLELAANKSVLTWAEATSIARPATALGDPLISSYDLPTFVERLTGMKDDLQHALPTFRR